MSDHVKIFDTTLRDGEQSPGISLDVGEKLEIAEQLARLGVDYIEAGFPVASQGDFEAVQAIARKVQQGELRPEDIGERTISDHLYTAGMPDPDLLIRTAGEMRVSNYLLWQISYAELVVSDVLWPDYGVPELHEAIRAFAARNRRFGALDHTNTRR